GLGAPLGVLSQELPGTGSPGRAMSTSEDRRITGKITLATIGRTIHPAPPPPPPAQRQAVPVPPPAAPRAKAAAPTPQPTKPAAAPDARATAPSKVAQQPSVTEEDRRIDARVAALAAAHTLLPEVFNDDGRGSF